MAQHDPQQAHAMLDAFASLGVTVFDVTMLDIDENEQGFQVRSMIEMKRSVAARLDAATREKINIIIRPRSATALLVQLDDLNDGRAGELTAHAFLRVQTSPGNNQVWLAVTDGPKETDKDAAKQLRKRIRAGTGADKSATGATRLAGSLNIKPKYAPDFPLVTVAHVNTGKTVTMAELDAAGLIAPPEAVTPPAPRSEPRPRIGPPPKSWPDYQRTLRGAPMTKDGSGPDRSLADFMWSKWAIQRGWTIEETAEKLAEVSDKARERARKDRNYPLLTARNAAAALQRDKGRTQVRTASARP